MSFGQAVLVTANVDSNGGIGFLGFAVIGGLGLVLVFLYRSMRRQLRRIDFDADATSDAERMRRPGSPDGDASQ